MVVLDTDHLTLLERRQSAGSHVLQVRLDQIDTGSRATTIVTYEEQTRGWMAYMARAKTVAQEIEAYARLKTHLHSFRHILVLDFDERAGVEYQRLRRSRVRIGTMDLKIAAIVLAHDATLLTKNVSDFRKVPFPNLLIVNELQTGDLGFAPRLTDPESVALCAACLPCRQV